MTRAARILMVTGEFPPSVGGVGDYTALLAKHLVTLGARVVVLTGAGDGAKVSLCNHGEIPVVRAVPGWGFRAWPAVTEAARRFEVRIVHIQYQAAAYSLHPAVTLMPAYLRARLRETRVVTTFHDLRVPYLFPGAGPLRRQAVRVLDALSHRAILTNQADLGALGGPGSLASRGSPRRLLIPLGSNIDLRPPPDFDRARWRRQLGAGEDTLLLSYFGFMNDSKGVEYLVQALGLLVGRGLESRLLIVGGQAGETDPTNRPYSRRVQRLIRSCHLEDRVHWTGFVPPQQVSAFLLSSDMCVLPFRDGASLRRGSLLAAILHGVPVVSTHPDPPEPLLVKDVNMSLVERESPAALAEAIEQLWRDPGSRARLAEGARLLAQRFDWTGIASRHLELYNEMLAEG